MNFIQRNLPHNNVDFSKGIKQHLKGIKTLVKNKGMSYLKYQLKGSSLRFMELLNMKLVRRKKNKITGTTQFCSQGFK